MPESLPLGEPAFDPQLAEHAVSSFAQAAAITLHVELIRGRNVHHIIEATFKGLARSLLKLITLRFGAPDAQTEARVRAASIEQLEAWTDAILTAPDLATLLGRQP